VRSHFGEGRCEGGRREGAKEVENEVRTEQQVNGKIIEED
jgi:hypothetical protein